MFSPESNPDIRYENHKILIVEDDIGLCRLIEKRLSAIGFQIKTLNTGKETVDFLGVNSDYLVILDYELSDYSGEVVIKNLRNKNITFPFIAITGHGNEKIAVQMMKLGALDYIVKDTFFLDLLPSSVIKVIKNLEIQKRLDTSLEELEKSEQRWIYALEGNGDGVWDVNLQTKTVFLSIRAREIIERDISEFDLSSKYWRTIVHDEDINYVYTSFQDHINNKSDQFHCEFRVVTEKKQEKWILARGKIIHPGSELKTPRMIGTLTDISEKKLNEEKIRKYNEEQLFLLNNIDTMVWYLKDQYTLGVVNNTVSEYFGLDKEDIEYKKIKNVFPQDFANDLTVNAQKVYLEKRKVKFQNNYINNVNIQRTLSVVLTPKLNNEGEVELVICLASDITDALRMEKEILKLDKLESLGLLAGGIAHDFNNILTGILANLSLAMIFAKDDEKILPRLREAEKACNRAGELTSQLLTFSKGGAPIKKLSDLKDMINDTAVFALRGSNISLQTDINKELYNCNVDLGQISQVINNLTLNARQAMPNGGKIKISAENLDFSQKFPQEPGLQNTLISLGKYVRITIHDQGIGIPKDYIDKIFDPFFTTKQTGNGLGLSTCFKIIRNHEGYLNVESDLGKGTVFRIYLPASEDKILKQEQPNSEKHLDFKGCALIVEKDKDIRDALSMILSDLGWHTCSLSDYDDIIKKYNFCSINHQKTCNLIFIDLVAPDDDSIIEITDKLRETDPQIKIIVSSGYSNTHIIQKYKDYGFSASINKPYSYRDIIDVLKSLK